MIAEVWCAIGVSNVYKIVPKTVSWNSYSIICVKYLRYLYSVIQAFASFLKRSFHVFRKAKTTWFIIQIWLFKISVICWFQTGKCKCKSGYYGSFCKRRCPQGTYGPDCVKRCPCEGAICDPETGECIHTCPPGYHGEKCDIGELVLQKLPRIVASEYFLSGKGNIGKVWWNHCYEKSCLVFVNYY